MREVNVELPQIKNLSNIIDIEQTMKIQKCSWGQQCSTANLIPFNFIGLKVNLLAPRRLS